VLLAWTKWDKRITAAGDERAEGHRGLIDFIFEISKLKSEILNSSLRVISARSSPAAVNIPLLTLNPNSKATTTRKHPM
jgi:hypothetical protein